MISGPSDTNCDAQRAALKRNRVSIDEKLFAVTLKRFNA
jgi:hypothetical protein